MDEPLEVEARTFRFANVVRALAVGFGADTPETIEVIKSKLKHLYGEGFAPPAQGRGREIEYTFDDIMDWAIALTLLSLGVPPKVMLRHLQRGHYAKSTKRYFRLDKPRTNHVFIIHLCNLLTEQIPGNPITWGVYAGKPLRDKVIGKAEKDGLDYAVSNFTRTWDAIYAELVRLIVAGIRP